ncbi:CPBP family intramembrane glutamic endopeptidase [Pedobacter rhizosphaerae]|nr:CPBP family intramembrane glutamic endopeptidase [Pedobacter rhizosphaerae]
MEEQLTTGISCKKCSNEIQEGYNFCNRCGQAINHEEIALYAKKWPNMLEVGLFFIIEIFCCATALIIDEPSLKNLFVIDVIMAIATILFFGYRWKENKTILKWPAFSLIKLLTFIGITIIASIGVSYSVDFLNRVVFEKQMGFYSIFAFHQYGTYLMFLSVALYPAIFEELAYRGYLMQTLLKVVDEKEAIYISSILFFIIHFSLVSVFWLLPFALFLGWLRIKTKTIWYGVFIHFFFNLTACVLDIAPLSDIIKLLF